MAVSADLRGDRFHVDIRGAFDQFVCFSRGIQVDLADVTAVRLATWDEVRPTLAGRYRGTYWPGLIATGWYGLPGRRRVRQFLAVYRDRSQLLAVDTTLERPARVVVATPRAVELADAIARRRPAAT